MFRRRRQARNPLFRKRWFADNTIIQCVNWYLRFKLSYRDLAQIMGQLGVSVAPSTILRWVIRYAVDFAESMRPYRHLKLFLAYYHESRTHLALAKDTPEHDPCSRWNSEPSLRYRKLAVFTTGTSGAQPKRISLVAVPIPGDSCANLGF